MKVKIAITALALSVSLLAGAKDDVVRDTLQFDRALASNPAAMLQGQISGVRVSATDGSINGPQNIYIRGVNALRGDSQPLWIVDGVIINSSFNQNREAFFNFGEESYSSPINALGGIDLYDIKSIEVLKDVSATALYGAQGANGVVIVTTKRGHHTLDVTWKSNVGLSTSPVTGTVKGLSHNHHIRLDCASKKTYYSVAAFLRKTNGVIEGNDNLYGGARAYMETVASNVVRFGGTMSASMGKSNSVIGSSYYGKPSHTLLMRYPSFFADESIDAWLGDYDDEADDRRASGSAYITFNFNPFLSWKTSLGVDFQALDRYIWYGDGTSLGYENNGAAGIVQSNIFKYNAQTMLNWKRSYSEKHNVNVTGALELLGENTQFNVTNATDFFNHALRARGLSLGASWSPTHLYDHDYFTFGGYAKASYDYDGLAGADALVRADRTAKYDTGAKIYWAANAFVDLRKALFSDSETISTLKFKAGYGIAGKEQYVPYGYFGNYTTSAYPVYDDVYTFERYYDGVNLLTSKEFNVGLDFGALADRFFLHLGYYAKSTDDNFSIYDFNANARAFKAQSQTTTIANRGIEADLNLGIIRNNNISWDVFGNIALNTNSLTAVDASDASGVSVGSNLVVNANQVGSPVGALCYDGKILGNPIPKTTYALGTTFKAFGFVLDVLADGASGFDILNLGDVLKDGATPSEKYVEKGDFFRLSRVSLGYSLKIQKDKKDKKFVKGIDFSLSGLNLATVTKYSGWDPDVNCFCTSAFSSGIDYGRYPSMRSAVLGITLKF